MPADAGAGIHAGGSGRSRLHPPRARASAAPTRGQPQVLEELILPARALPIVAPAAVGQGAVAAHSLHSRPGLGLGLHGRGGCAGLGARSLAAGARAEDCTIRPLGVTPLRLRQWRGRAGCGDPDPRGPLPCAPVPRGRGCGNWTAYLFISDVCSTLPWQPLHLFRRRQSTAGFKPCRDRDG